MVLLRARLVSKRLENSLEKIGSLERSACGRCEAASDAVKTKNPLQARACKGLLILAEGAGFEPAVGY